MIMQVDETLVLPMEICHVQPTEVKKKIVQHVEDDQDDHDHDMQRSTNRGEKGV